MTPLQTQRAARKRVGYGPIFLRRQGDRVLVQIEFGGEWRTVISEVWDSNFSHIVEPLGIDEEMERADPDRIEIS